MVDSHVHLAHALVKYMGMESPRDLIDHGINGIGELVDLISKASFLTLYHYQNI